MRSLPWMTFLIAIALAGCVGGGTASVTLEGAGPSGTSSGAGTCEGEGVLQGEVVASTGALRVRVLDGDARVLFDEQLRTGVLERTLTGAPGMWRVEASGSSDYDGRNVIRFDC